MSLRRTGGKAIILLAVFGVVSLGSRPAPASVFQTFGASPRAIALGNAYTAVADDWSAVFYNPAGLSQIRDLKATLGFHYVYPNLEARFSDGGDHELGAFPGKDGGVSRMGAITAGLVIPVDQFLTRKLPIPISIGSAIVVPNLYTSGLIIAPDRFPQDVLFNDRSFQMGFYTGLAVQVLPMLSIGVSVMLSQATSVEFYEGINTTDALDIKKSIAGPIVTAGLLFRPSDILRFGITYFQELDTRESIVTGRLIEYPALSNTSFVIIDRQGRDISAGEYWPQGITFGAAWKISQRWLLSGSFSWFEWSSYISPNGLKPFNDFEDTYVARVGAEYRLTKKFDLRAGFAYDPTPVTRQPAGYNPVGNDRLINSIGCGWSFSDPLGLMVEPIDLDFVFQFQLLQSRTVSEKAFLPPLTGVDPEIETKGFAICSAISLSTKF